MKVVTPQEMARIESLAYSAGASEADFMEEAGKGIASRVDAFVSRSACAKEVVLLCGKGNNSGDAYVAGRYLLEQGYRVTAIQVKDIAESSQLCRKNHDRFIAKRGNVEEFKPRKSSPFPKDAVIIDGLFGTGFHGVARNPYGALIRSANASKLPIIAIDIPSGLDGATGHAEGEVIVATETIYLGLPKLGFFVQDGWNYVGRLRYVNFGLDQEFIDQAESDLEMPQESDLRELLPPVRRNRHKYQAGLVVGLAGSPGMPGAAILSITAAIKSGAGIVRLMHPDGMQAELAACPPEIIRVPYSVQSISSIAESLSAGRACFIGPGIGRSTLAKALLEVLLPKLKVPCVLDADALYHLAHSHVLPPAYSVITPHYGEMGRLLHLDDRPDLTHDFLEQCQRYVEEHNVTLVLKGGPTCVLHPGRPKCINACGDPGMATAGSGDVLTGLIAACMAQGLAPHSAALLGVYLHAKAGEYAAEAKTSYCMVASDITEALPRAFAGK